MSINSKEDVVVCLAANCENIYRLGVKTLAIFGSFVRGEGRVESDVDFIVEFFPGKKTFDNFMKLSFFLEDILGRPVDLVTPESLSPHIGTQILEEAENVLLAA